jgi:hypothetical protein
METNMLALLLAMSAATASPAPAIAALPDRPLVFRNGLNFIPSACRAGITVAGGPTALLRPEDMAQVKPRRLGDLPKAHLEIAINRMVAGCSAPVIVRYDVEGDGRAAKGAGGD